MAKLKLILILSATIAGLGSAMAGLDSLTAEELAAVKKELSRPGVYRLVMRPAAKKAHLRQVVATAITRTLVRLETRQARSLVAGAVGTEIRIRQGRLLLTFRRKPNERHCRLQVGRRLEWETVNGQWSGGRVRTADLQTVLRELKRHGIAVSNISLAVKARQQVKAAEALLVRLGLAGAAIVGHDPGSVSHATVTFTKTRN